MLTKVDQNWYKGEPLLKVLEKIEHIHVKEEITKPMRLVVKNVFKGLNNRAGYGFTVKVESGILEIKDKVLIMPCNMVTSINHIYGEHGKLDYAICGDTVDITAVF